MSAACLLQSEKDKLVTAIRSGDLDMGRLYDMNADQAREVLGKVVGEDSARMVNAEFQKAKITATKKAAADYVTSSEKPGFSKTATQGEFAKNLLNDTQKRDRAVAALDERIQNQKDLQTKNQVKIDNATDAEQKANLEFKNQKYQDTIDRLSVRRQDTATPVNDRLVNKINSMQTLLSDGDYNDLASAKLGRDLSPAQGDYIAKQATELRDLARDTTNPENKDFGMSAEYYNKKANLQSFIDSLDPKNPINALSRGIDIARLSLITGFSTPIKVLANYTNHPAGIILRRIASLSLRGDNADVAKELNTKDAAFTKKTGTSLSQLRDKNDIGTTLGSHTSDSTFKKETFNTPQKGVGGLISRGLSKVENAFHFVAIKLEHQYSYNYVWRNTFYDVLNIRASSFARAEGLKGADIKPRAEEIMRDAARLDPQTEAGKALREGAQAVAAKTTNTNDTVLSKASVGIKNALNQAGNQVMPGLNIGDLYEPMAKIPANVIANAIDLTPQVGIPHALYDGIKGRINMMPDKPLETRYQGLLQYKKGVEHLIGVFGSLGAAALLTSNLTQKDFRTDKWGNQFVNLGGKLWVNSEYMSRIAPNVAGLMAIKMNPKENPVSAFILGKTGIEGSLGSVIRTPGIDVPAQVTTGTLQAGLSPVKSLEGAVTSRFPSILTNLFKPGDLERKTFRVFSGASGVETDQEYKDDTKASAQKAAATKRANAAAKAKQGR